MENNLPVNINLTKNDNKIGKLIKNYVKHQLKVSIDPESYCTDAYLDFTSEEALYDFALSLLHSAIYSKKLQKRYTPIKDNNGNLFVKDGIRLSEDSCDLIISVINQNNNNNLPTEISITKNPNENDLSFMGDEVAALTWQDEKHQLKVSINEEENYALFLFSTREMLYDFAIALLSDVINNEVAKECLPYQDFDGRIPSCDGVRMSLDSSRLFIFWGNDDFIDSNGEDFDIDN